MRIVRQVSLALSTLIQTFRTNLLRIIAPLLLTIVIVNLCAPTTAFAAATSPAPPSRDTSTSSTKSVVDKHAKSPDPRFTTADQRFKYPGPMPQARAAAPAAVDARPNPLSGRPSQGNAANLPGA